MDQPAIGATEDHVEVLTFDGPLPTEAEFGEAPPPTDFRWTRRWAAAALLTVVALVAVVVVSLSGHEGQPPADRPIRVSTPMTAAQRCVKLITPGVADLATSYANNDIAYALQQLRLQFGWRSMTYKVIVDIGARAGARGFEWGQDAAARQAGVEIRQACARLFPPGSHGSL